MTRNFFSMRRQAVWIVGVVLLLLVLADLVVCQQDELIQNIGKMVRENRGFIHVKDFLSKMPDGGSRIAKRSEDVKAMVDRDI